VYPESLSSHSMKARPIVDYASRHNLFGKSHAVGFRASPEGLPRAAESSGSLGGRALPRRQPTRDAGEGSHSLGLFRSKGPDFATPIVMFRRQSEIRPLGDRPLHLWIFEDFCASSEHEEAQRLPPVGSVHRHAWGLRNPADQTRNHGDCAIGLLRAHSGSMR
jgi:hypothetical protein